MSISCNALDALNGSMIWNATARDGWAAPAIGDFNGDSLPDVVCPDSNNIKVYCGLNGSIIWSYAIEDVFAHATESASLADVNDDDKLDVIVGGEDGHLYVIANNGSLLWNFTRRHSDAFALACAVGDVDNDGILEIAHVQNWHYYAARYARLYVLNAEDGSTLWGNEFTDVWINEAPVIGDVNGDHIQEVIVSYTDYLTIGGVVAFSGMDGSEVWTYSHAPGTNSCPALGDINNDNSIDVVFGWDQAVIALSGSDGSKLWEVPHETKVTSSPALADIDDDGELDVIIGGGFESRKLYILKGSSGDEIWSYTTPPIDHPTFMDSMHASATLWDLDGDYSIEMIVQANDHTYMFDIEGAGERVFWQGLGGTSEFTQTRCLGEVDPDGDFVSSYTEEVIGTDDTNSDSDSDTLLDNEIYLYGTNPNSADTDQDAMPDNWEIQHSLDPLMNDSNNDNDSDGYSNLTEYLNGTDPNVWDPPQTSSTTSDGTPLPFPFELLVVGITGVGVVIVILIIVTRGRKI